MEVVSGSDLRQVPANCSPQAKSHLMPVFWNAYELRVFFTFLMTKEFKGRIILIFISELSITRANTRDDWLIKRKGLFGS